MASSSSSPINLRLKLGLGLYRRSGTCGVCFPFLGVLRRVLQGARFLYGCPLVCMHRSFTRVGLVFRGKENYIN